MATTASPQQLSAEHDLHLCVMVHGLWGNPGHLAFLSKKLKEAHPDLHIILPKTNAGNLTYDGIEVGGERVTEEVEQELEELRAAKKKVSKISVIGYSLGGLIARYAVGLLHSRGVFKDVEPVNFTTFATPHLGARSPMEGWKTQIFNVLGSRTLSVSGMQLFGTDTFRDTGRPLLALMADPDSIFIKGLASFRTRQLYANIINDRTVPFYTAAISRYDPFANLALVDLHSLPDYEGVILDPENPATPNEEGSKKLATFADSARSVINGAPLALAWTIFLPIGVTVYLANSGWQYYASGRRVREHEQRATSFRQLPLLLEDARRRTVDAVDNLTGGKLSAAEKGDASEQQHDSDSAETTDSGVMVVREKTLPAVAAPPETSEESKLPWPTLALTPDQFDMVKTLQPMFQRNFVHITKAMHSHAAMIRRLERASFDEAFVVARHWVERFAI